MKKTKATVEQTAKIVLGDSDKWTRKIDRETKRKTLTGKNWDTLKAKEKDDLLKLVCEQAGLIDALGNVV